MVQDLKIYQTVTDMSDQHVKDAVSFLPVKFHNELFIFKINCHSIREHVELVTLLVLVLI